MAGETGAMNTVLLPPRNASGTSNTTSAATQSEGLVGLADTTFDWWSPVNPYRTGFLPSYAPQSGTASELRNLINTMSPTEIYNLKRRLWAAGFYDKVFPKLALDTTNVNAAELQMQEEFTSALKNRYVPNSGIWGENFPTGNLTREQLQIAGTGVIGIDDAALEKAITDFRTSGMNSFDQFLSSQIAKTNAERQGAIASVFGLEQLNQSVQSMSAELIGRELSTDELNSFYQRVFGAEPTMNRAGDQNVLVGGNLSSSAIQYGKQIGSSYGLVSSGLFEIEPSKYGEMNQAVADGLVVQYRGDQKNLEKLQQWVATNIGDDKTFTGIQEMRDSSGQLTGIRVAMREGAKVPNSVYFTGISSEQVSEDDFQRFLNAAREPYGASGYQWETPVPGRYGAYGISEDVWNYYGNMEGVDIQDKSAANQDVVARLYLSDLYARYKGDWQLVAVAFQGGKDLADSMYATAPDAVTGLDYLSGSYADLDSVKSARTLIDRMGKNVFGKGVNSIPQTSLSALTMGSFDVGREEPLRTNDPKELVARQQRIFKDAYKYEIASNRIFEQLSKDVTKNVFETYIERRRKEIG